MFGKKSYKTLIAEKYCRPDISALAAEIIGLGYLIVAESGDPEIKPDPDDTLRIFMENDYQDLKKLSGVEQWYLVSELKQEFGL